EGGGAGKEGEPRWVRNLEARIEGAVGGLEATVRRLGDEAAGRVTSLEREVAGLHEDVDVRTPRREQAETERKLEQMREWVAANWPGAWTGGGEPQAEGGERRGAGATVDLRLQAARESRGTLESLLSVAEGTTGEEEWGGEVEDHTEGADVPPLVRGDLVLHPDDEEDQGADVTPLVRGDVVLHPDDDEDQVIEALEGVEGGGRVHFRAGQYTVGGPVVLDGAATVTGDPDVVLLGRWAMQSKGSGLVMGVKLVNIAGGVAGAIRDEMAGYTPPTMRTLVQPCVMVWGGPWRVDHCEVALRVFKQGSVDLHYAGIGGLGPDTDAASLGISIQEQGFCSLDDCLVEHTTPGGMGGICVQDRAEGRVRDSVIRNHASGISITGRGVLTVERCRFEHVRDAAVVFLKDATRSTVAITSSSVYGGELLGGASRPDRLVLEHNELGGASRPERLVLEHNEARPEAALF
ncbi:hypothetical protein T484DRAFT_1765690, partial [Baffinella frigidus]